MGLKTATSDAYLTKRAQPDKGTRPV
jgi:hypothetical protein